MERLTLVLSACCRMTDFAKWAEYCSRVLLAAVPGCETTDFVLHATKLRRRSQTWQSLAD